MSGIFILFYMSMLIVTHEMNFAKEVAYRVLFFADGGIYEQGTPKEIFDNPKKDKTIAFIQKIKYLSFDIEDRHFDLMALHGGIQSFGEKSWSTVSAIDMCSTIHSSCIRRMRHCLLDGNW